VSDNDIEAILQHAASGFQATHQDWIKFRQDLFAPDEFFVLVKIRGFLAREGYLSALDGDGVLLPLVFRLGERQRLEEGLMRGQPQAVLGVLGKHNDQLRMRPLSIILRDRGKPLIWSLPDADQK
jgi:hypothetical protein